MNKKGMHFLGYWFLFCVFLLIVSLSFFTIKINQVKNSDCLISIAKEDCSERGMVYEKVLWVLKPVFMCNEDGRSMESQMFKFLEEEIEGCKK